MGGQPCGTWRGQFHGTRRYQQMKNQASKLVHYSVMSIQVKLRLDSKQIIPPTPNAYICTPRSTIYPTFYTRAKSMQYAPPFSPIPPLSQVFISNPTPPRTPLPTLAYPFSPSPKPPRPLTDSNQRPHRGSYKSSCRDSSSHKSTLSRGCSDT
jgi:hypothetical protein